MKRKINYLFWFFWVISILFGMVEAISYSGFIEKHLRIDFTLFIVLAVIFALFTLVFNLRKQNIIIGKYDKTPIIIFCFLLLIYVVFVTVEKLSYPNFVFSILHIQPSNILKPLLISLTAVLVVWIPKLNSLKASTFKSVLFFLIVALVIFNIYKTYKLEYLNLQFIATSSGASYDDKMRETLGSNFYNLTQFIKNNTSSDSSILIPPQAFPWPQSGNTAYLRYFVHPRKLTSGKELEPPANLKDYDYVILNWGETESVEPPYTHNWPKFDIEAIKTIFMNKDGSFLKEEYGNFYYKKYEGKKVWGLIEVKH